ncbi:hypothetical protein E2C01_001287 [Portunus trituberculatus]|uniref:Uncharacterized protein n=1 Tax=Portunus trituberculatus TaxID=210409 RepID=A0A5B7CJ06_PORTR|nr:hypothetical protein [Portunus trituberculatus]
MLRCGGETSESPCAEPAIAQQSIAVRRATLWNQLPDNLKNVTSQACLKSRVKSHPANHGTTSTGTPISLHEMYSSCSKLHHRTFICPKLNYQKQISVFDRVN